MPVVMFAEDYLDFDEAEAQAEYESALPPMEDVFEWFLEEKGFSSPSQVGRGDVDALVIAAEEQGFKDSFIVWMLEHKLRFGVRDDLKEQLA